jgi:predicted dehydrogenase
MLEALGARDVTVTLAGEGAEAERWARLLRGIDGVSVSDDPAYSDAAADIESTDAVHAAVFVTPVADLHSSIKRALVAGQHVLVAGPVALNAPYLTALDVIARARRRVAMFDSGSANDERLAFARRMTGGRQPIWRPRYVRALRTGRTAAGLDELAIAEIEVVLGILGGAPSSVSAVAPRSDDESGAAGVAMITLLFEGGAVASIDVSLVEPQPRHEVTIACDGRTIVLDTLDARAPLQIHGAGRHNGPQRGQWAETVIEHPLAPVSDAATRTADAFIAAARAEDAAATNAACVALAARVWECARTSISRFGQPQPLVESAVEPPSLRLIHGRGRSDDRAHAPRLTVVTSHHEDERPHSA